MDRYSWPINRGAAQGGDGGTYPTLQSRGDILLSPPPPHFSQNLYFDWLARGQWPPSSAPTYRP